MIQAINGRDYPLMQGILLMTTILMLTTNFIADISVFFLIQELEGNQENNYGESTRYNMVKNY